MKGLNYGRAQNVKDIPSFELSVSISLPELRHAPPPPPQLSRIGHQSGRDHIRKSEYLRFTGKTRVIDWPSRDIKGPCARTSCGVPTSFGVPFPLGSLRLGSTWSTTEDPYKGQPIYIEWECIRSDWLSETHILFSWTNDNYECEGKINKMSRCFDSHVSLTLCIHWNTFIRRSLNSNWSAPFRRKPVRPAFFFLKVTLEWWQRLARQWTITFFILR